MVFRFSPWDRRNSTYERPIMIMFRKAINDIVVVLFLPVLIFDFFLKPGDSSSELK
jgi:predicted permease